MRLVQKKQRGECPSGIGWRYIQEIPASIKYIPIFMIVNTNKTDGYKIPFKSHSTENPNGVRHEEGHVQSTCAASHEATMCQHHASESVPFGNLT